MRRIITFLWVLLLFQVGSAQDITWSDQIGCLVYSHCTPCHNNQGIAPFTLESYQDAYDHRFSMEEAISRKAMPPWPPNEKYSRLRGERLLTDHEVAVFKTWVQSGAPQGDPALSLNAPVYDSPLEIKDPDFSYTLPDFTIPDVQELDLYRCFRIPTHETEDRFITGVEIIPGNRSVVHHVLLFADTSEIPAQLDEEDPGPGYTCFGGIGSETFTVVSGWVPGSSANFAPRGMGILLPAGADLVVQLHYPEGSAGEVDATTINLKYADQVNLRPLLNIPAINHFTSLEEELYIPANTKKTFHAQQEVPFDITITGIAPHAHLICESMRAFAVTPTGDTIKLIDVPHWDFDWQGFYDFQRPKRLPFGSVLHGTVTYNNTTSNKHLPSDSPTDVWVGEATTDEMLLFFMTLTFYFPGDEEMIIDTTSHTIHHDDCSTSGDLTIANNPEQEWQSILVGPNPTSGRIFVSIPNSFFTTSSTTLVVYDMLGRTISRHVIDKSNTHIDLPTFLASGIYWYGFESASSPNFTGLRKLTVVR